MRRIRWSETIVGVAIGFGAGIALGMLFAPQSGEETRDYIAGNTKEGIHNAKKRVEDAKDLVSDVLKTGKGYVRQAKDTLDDAKGSIRERVTDVARESERAYQEAKNS